MAERNTAEELDDVYEIKYSTDAMTGGADKRMYLYYQLANSIKKADSVDIIVSFFSKIEAGIRRWADGISKIWQVKRTKLYDEGIASCFEDKYTVLR